MSDAAPQTPAAELVRRATSAAPLTVTGLLAATGAGLSAAQWHAHLWQDYRTSLEMFSTMRARAAELGLPVLDASFTPTPPGVWGSTVSGLSDALVMAAVALLGVALVTAGHRLWGLTVPMLLNVLPLWAGWPLLSAVALPGANDPSTGPLLWWASSLLIGVAMTLPAAIAARGPAAEVVARVPSRTALLRSGAVAVIALGGALLWTWSLYPGSLSWSEALAEHGSAALLILATGQIAATLPLVRLRRWAAVAALLLVLDITLTSGALIPGHMLWLPVSESLLRAGTLVIGPLAVLATPAAGRAWHVAFRRTRPDGARETLAPV
ncbi:hypothetical protein [Cellulomonas timonensis]|uniref:hypothetical protein n=1 Tax=Cellulomonas timonensis TaxID=1689271 RepID=UPI00082F9275|nr:hypothetical protein [Cellulomonas timonensis]